MPETKIDVKRLPSPAVSTAPSVDSAKSAMRLSRSSLDAATSFLGSSEFKQATESAIGRSGYVTFGPGFLAAMGVSEDGHSQDPHKPRIALNLLTEAEASGQRKFDAGSRAIVVLSGAAAVGWGFNLNTNLGLATIPLAAAGLTMVIQETFRDTSRLTDARTVVDGITEKAEDDLSALREGLEHDESMSPDTATPEDLASLLVRQSTLQTEVSAIMKGLRAVFRCEAPALQQ